MRNMVKSLAAVALYLILLSVLLKTEIILLLSPAHIGMFLLGSIILCVPHLEKGMKWRGFGNIFRENAILAGTLESFTLLFVSMNLGELPQEQILRELVLDVRPMFYGFVCYEILKEKKGQIRTEEIPAEEKPGKEDSGKKLPRQSVPQKEPDLSVLTRQEKQVAALVKAGLTNREIGEELCISESTVKKHMSNIFEKLQISSRKELKK